MVFLNLSGLQTLKFVENEHDYHVSAETGKNIDVCLKCGNFEVVGFGTKNQLFMDLPSHGKRVGIWVKRKRGKCKRCNKTFWEGLPEMNDKRQCTKRLIKYIQEHSVKRTFTSIAEDVGVNEKTIRNIFKDHVSFLESKYSFDTPKWLGIDEVHLNRTMRCVITNIEQRTLVDMLPSRTKKTVISAFSLMKDRENVELVSMDMWRPYKDAALTVFPDAKIIIDKFHVIKMANEALEKVRKATRENLTTKECRALMNDRFVLLKREHNLRDDERLKLSGWTLNYPDLGKGYEIKESFYKIWESSDKYEAQEAYQSWLGNIPKEMKVYFGDLTKATGNWNDEIFTYFDHRITNAYTESLNNLIKVIYKVGRGYSFDALRAKILYSESLHKTKRPKFKRNQYEVNEEFFSFGKSMGCGLPDPVEEIKIYGSDISTLIKKIQSGEIK